MRSGALDPGGGGGGGADSQILYVVEAGELSGFDDGLDTEHEGKKGIRIDLCLRSKQFERWNFH